MTQKAKAILFHWVVEMSAGLIVIAVGVGLVVYLPEAKQGEIKTSAYTGSPAWGVIILGVLAILNSVRRALLRKKS